MWYEIFKFEIIYRIKRPETYIFFAFLCCFSIVGVEFIFNGFDFGAVKMNAPIVIAKSMAAITGLTMIIASLIMGVPILRDFEHNMESLMYVNPIKKSDYLLGRFLGSFVILLFAYSGMLLGFILGEFTPLYSAEEAMSFRLMAYVQPFTTIIIPTLFFTSSLFFVTGALTKKLIVVYTQGVFIFVTFLLTKAVTNNFAQGVLDPFSLTTLTDVNEIWSTTERNINLIPLTGIVFYNKLFWFIISLSILVFGFYRFNFQFVSKKPKKKKPVTLKGTSSIIGGSLDIPQASMNPKFINKIQQLLALSWFYIKSTCKQTSFWAIVLCGLLIILINSINLQNEYGIHTLPKTYMVVEELQELSLYFFLILVVFYSGELIWKEREANLHLIFDATSIADSISLTAKFLGLLGIYVIMILSLIGFGIAFQISKGYYQFELDVYFYGFFIELFPYLILYTIVSFFFHVLVNKKFAGFILLMVFALINFGTEALGFEHDLYKFGGGGLTSYSDMNGYGNFLKPYLWIKIYWTLFAILLFILSIILSVRGTETKLKNRLRNLPFRFTKSLKRIGMITSILFIAIGSYILYNTNIINDYNNTFDQGELYAKYEKKLKKYEYLAQPKITQVDLNVELYPKKRNYTIKGQYILKNSQNKPINSIYVQKALKPEVQFSVLNFEEIADLNDEYSGYGFYIFELNKALQPDDSIKLNFQQIYITKGFTEHQLEESIIKNGSYLSNNSLPTLGYNKALELQNTDFRKQFSLKPRKGFENRNHSVASTYRSISGDADLIDLEVKIGTDINQKAITSGDLIEKWKKDGRSYFHYKTKHPIINDYAIFSAEYEVFQDSWIPNRKSSLDSVALQIYYHDGHEYNLKRMSNAIKLSFDYYNENFNSYGHNQIRIIETSNHIDDIQTVPGIIPFSEINEFILNPTYKNDLPMFTYTIAYNLAQQWWRMKLGTAYTKGRNLIIGTLSRYSALMVIKHNFSNVEVGYILQKEEDLYLEGKKRDNNQGVSLEMVENQKYIYANKGAINMYKLQEKIGEDNVNLALCRFMNDWGILGSQLKSKKDKYATSKDLLQYLEDIVPKKQEKLIIELFKSGESIN